MKLLYLANARMPTEKAHGAQIVKNCEAFANLGHDVTLVVPWRFNKLSRENPFDYYGVEKNFQVARLPSLDLVRFGRLGFIIQTLTFTLSCFIYALLSRAQVYYSREHIVLWPISFIKSNLIWEPHDGKWNFMVAGVAKRAGKIAAITHGVKNYLVERGVKAEKVLVAPDGIDPNDFANPESRAEARKRLGIDANAKVAMYLGHLHEWKGYRTLLEASKLLPDIKIVLSGGSEKQLTELHRQYPEVKFLGVTPYRDLANNQQAADVLVVPNTAREAISEHFTSPLKVFAHMTSEVPIVASDLPSLREVLNEQNAILVTPDNPEALAKGITGAISSPGEIAREAKKNVEDYTWAKRAREIMNETYG